MVTLPHMFLCGQIHPNYVTHPWWRMWCKFYIYICPWAKPNTIWEIPMERESTRQLFLSTGQPAPLFIALHVILAPHSLAPQCPIYGKVHSLSVVWRQVTSISTGWVLFVIFRWPLAMFFSGWTLLTICQDDLSWKIDVKCLEDKLTCKNTWPPIHTWPLSQHQMYMATGLLNMQWPILKIEEDEITYQGYSCLYNPI